MVICIFSVLGLIDCNFTLKSDVFAQVITNSEEEYMQLSNILENTEKSLEDVVKAINSWEKDNALNIISNITMNVKEIEIGINLLVDNPIHGGD